MKWGPRPRYSARLVFINTQKCWRNIQKMFPKLAFSSVILDDSCENEHTFFKTQNPKTTPYPPLLDAHITGHEIIKKVGLCDLEKFRKKIPS